MDLPGPLLVVPPSRRPHTHTVIFLHGRGSTARKLAEGLHHFTDARSRSLFEMFPSFRWVFPQAPLRERASSGDKTYQWFDVWDARDPAEREEVQRAGLAESVGRVGRLVREEGELLGSCERVVLAGRRGLGGVIGFSCRLPLARGTLGETRAEVGVGKPDEVGETLRGTPVLLEHCVDDPLVPVGAGRELRDKLAMWGAQVTWKEYPTGGHWLNSPSGAEDVAQFLRAELHIGRDGYLVGGV
ncbi:hypothetical protein VUR80DRAFT_9418 [Thermomyces stellatus]